ATVGLGGHSEALLEAGSRARLLGIDRDPRALERARERLARFGSRVRLVEGRHESLIEILRDSEVQQPGTILADLGVSSMQLDDASRGFSFRFEGPLDMRMGAGGTTAADLVSSLDVDELTRILREYGEEPMARKIARAIVEARVEAPIETTSQLAAIIRKAKPQRGDRIDPATLTFQALRIATNEELIGLERFVEDAVEAVGEGGRVGVIAFHSLEDRIVKRVFRRLEGECTCPPDLPVCGCGAVQVVRVLTHRPLVADDSEIAQNPRARSAKLRVAEKVS
ncbi:MAG TPA: 16S rRNA (cytosine(1402)-N(4))-methyltransferase RsmH, partial [Thermoanaerobaculia bacterium]|nr:16S rRNA (cytosine(1402)-N(4))-methyltransferase RsmH [Thermoanaerobaculia bacterium]